MARNRNNQNDIISYRPTPSFKAEQSYSAEEFPEGAYGALEKAQYHEEDMTLRSESSPDE